VQENREKSMLQLIVLQNDMAQNPLGIKAHYFVLTYGVLVTVLKDHEKDNPY